MLKTLENMCYGISTESEEREPLLGRMSPNKDNSTVAKHDEDVSNGVGDVTSGVEDVATKAPDVTVADQRRRSQLDKIKRFCSHALSSITLEPMLFLKMVAEGNLIVVSDTLEIDRVCRVNLNYSAADCQAMDDGNHTEIQNEVQIYQNTFNYHQNLMGSFIPLLVILLIGPLTDRYGRKPAMISVLVGFIGFTLVYILAALNPTWPVQVLYGGTLFVSLGGTWVVFNMAVYSYIADITDSESRTKRMGFADAVWYSGSPIGTMIGGYVYKGFGFVAVYALSGILWTVCLLYTIFILKESRRFNTEGDRLVNQENEGRCHPFKHLTSLFGTVFKKRPGNGQIKVLVLIGLKLGVFLVQGHQMFLWARKVLQWDTTTFSTWSSLEEGSHQAGMVGWVWLSERLHLHDCTIANGGLVSILLWSVTLACITGPSLWWLTIVASLLGLLEASIEPAIRSMLTTVVGIGEEGKVLTALGIMESAWLAADRALYTWLYNSFVDSLPQINFIVQAGFSVVLIVVVVLLKRAFLNTKTDEPVMTQIAN